ncbi:DinB family protein [Salipaludibacillus sp. CF4.18]|uniref:DinB family protein n=1 Tax=Salipaludibacillus sp. CF4.18 TaxID=3373081 RepID=UPI003EE5DE4B
MSTEKIEQYISSINTSFDNILNSVDGLSEEVIRQNPTEEEWSILQILTHLTEATPYWLGEMERVVESPGSKWGRGLKDPDRLSAVENTESLKVNVVIAEVKDLKEEVSNRVSRLNDAQLAEENPHRNFEKFGNKPVSFLIEHFIVEHTAKHHGQIERNLNKLSKPSN